MKKIKNLIIQPLWIFLLATMYAHVNDLIATIVCTTYIMKTIIYETSHNFLINILLAHSFKTYPPSNHEPTPCFHKTGDMQAPRRGSTASPYWRHLHILLKSFPYQATTQWNLRCCFEEKMSHQNTSADSFEIYRESDRFLRS